MPADLRRIGGLVRLPRIATRSMDASTTSAHHQFLRSHLAEAIRRNIQSESPFLRASGETSSRISRHHMASDQNRAPVSAQRVSAVSVRDRSWAGRCVGAVDMPVGAHS